MPRTVAEAEAAQEALRPRLILDQPGPATIRTAAGLDVAYGGDDRLAAAVVVLDAGTLSEVDRAVVAGRADFPYAPGLFAFRELPTLVDALSMPETTRAADSAARAALND